MQHRNSIRPALLMVLLVFFSVYGLTGCGAKDGRRVISASEANRNYLAYSVEDARERLGPPDSVVTQGDGLIRHTWVYHNEIVTPERIVFVHFGGSREIYGDRFRVIPESRRIEYCIFNIFTDSNDIMKNISQEGNACPLLLQSRQAGFTVNSLPRQE